MALAACRSAPPPFDAAAQRAVADSVRATFADYVARLNARDIDSVIRFYSHDSSFVWMEDGMVRYRTPDDIRKELARLPSYKQVRFSFDAPLVIALGPGAATLTSTFDQALLDSAGGGFAVVGAMTIAARHTPAGWKWATGHTSVRREPK